MKRLPVLLVATFVCGTVLYAQKTPFSQDSAYANLHTLVNEIGPRPMGSPAEQRALQFAVSKFKSYGCQEAYVMPMTVAAGVNTRSGIAVGILKGKTDRIIIIGGHIDSSGPDIPGANDDGSGVATVIELARVISGRQNESTVVFCCWGGEEEGLRGSEHFVATFSRMDSVALMFQIDMADGSGELYADPDGEDQVSAPRWLVEAAFDIFYNDLRHEGMIYPTQAATINASVPGGTGSDHMPFLKRGIPAIDFTSDVSFPIHSPLDNWKNFNPSGLARSGDLVLKLFEKYDGGVPSRGTEAYWLVVIGKTPLFFSHVILRGVALVAVLVAFGVLLILRRKRSAGDPAARVKWSGVKLILFTVIIMTLLWLSENVVGLVKGYRYPWVNNFGGFVVLAVLSGLLGLWLCLRIARTLRLSADPYVYYLRAFILLFVLTILLSLPNAELGVYPALSLLLFSLSVAVRPPVLKALLIVLTPLPLIRLVFLEYLGLFQRMLTQVSRESVLASAATNAGFILLITLLALPFVYAFAAVYRGAGGDLFWVKKFSGMIGLLAVVSGIIIMGTVLLFRPVYNESWQPGVRLSQLATIGADTGKVTITSGEYLKGVKLAYDGRDTTLEGEYTVATIPTMHPATVSWLGLAESSSQEKSTSDTLATFTRILTLRSAIRPLSVTVTYRSSSPFTARSSWAMGSRRRTEKDSDRVKTFTWYAFPESVLVVPVTFAVRDTQKIKESIEATYDTLAYPVRASRDMTFFTYRTTVNASRTFSAPHGTE